MCARGAFQEQALAVCVRRVGDVCVCVCASCRTCGRVVCDDCSSKRLKSGRTCAACWDRLGRKMSGLGLTKDEDDDAAAAAAAAANGGVRKSALVELLEVRRAVCVFAFRFRRGAVRCNAMCGCV